MNLKKLIAALCIAGGLIAAGFIGYDNDYPIEKIAQQLNNWAANNPIEKVYLQFDKPYYAVGDDMWFKAYVTLGPDHKLSALSGVLNVELIDERDSVVQHIKLPLVSGLTWGDFALNDSLHEGNYRVRAYTNWMCNAGEDYFFDKHISIVNPLNNKAVAQTIPVKSIESNIDVQFFPESGYLVNGINTKVAFKAVGPDGLGAEIKGSITDDANNMLTTFSSKHLGMGVFNLLPLAGKSYKANVVFADGSSKSFDLPRAIDKGYVLAIDNSDTANIHVKISTSKTILLDNANDTVSLIAQLGGKIYYAAKSAPGTAIFTADIPKKRFPSGIVQFSLISSKQGALNERLVFIQNPDQLKLDVNTDRQTYSPQQKVNIQLNAKNADNKPVQGSFSVSVVDETKVPENEEDESTILSNLLLTSDLKGYVEKPNYYFTNVNEQIRADLDVLMLTQGYSRFEWKDVLKNNFPAITYQPEKTLEVDGHITKINGKPLANAKVSLVSSKGTILYLDTVTDAKGRFIFDNLAFNDSLRFVIQAQTDKGDKYVKITLDNISPQKITSNKKAPDFKLNINEGLSTYLQSSKILYQEKMKYGLTNHTYVLKEVEIKGKKDKLKHSANLNGPGVADYVLVAGQFPPSLPLAQSLEGRIPGVTFVGGLPVAIKLAAASIQGAPPMRIMVDGTEMPPEYLSSLNMHTVQSIEVIDDIAYAAVYGARANGGVLVITSKQGDEGISEPAPGILFYSPIGYYKIRTFYSPHYDDPKTNIPVANLRSTIYWNPNMITDKDGNTSFQYFNAGSKGTYRVVIEGIDNDGNIGRRVFRYKVD